MVKNSELSPKQIRTITALISSRNLGEACEAAGISRSTLARWMADPQFNEALTAVEADAVREVSLVLIAGRNDALTVLQHLMLSSSSDSTKLQAVTNWLNLMQKFIGLYKLEERITKLEVSQNE